MRATPTALDGVVLLEPKVFGDERGFFLESFNQQAFDAAIGSQATFVQDNHSRSARGVLRGLHLQMPPQQQGKLVRVVHGSVFDVAVDLRPGSPTFGRWEGVDLSARTIASCGSRPASRTASGRARTPTASTRDEYYRRLRAERARERPRPASHAGSAFLHPFAKAGKRRCSRVPVFHGSREPPAGRPSRL